GSGAPIGVARVRDESTGGVVVTGASGAGLSQCISGGAEFGAPERAAAIPYADVCAARRPCHRAYPVIIDCLAGVDAVGICRPPSIGSGGDEAGWTVCRQPQTRNGPSDGRASARSVCG